MLRLRLWICAIAPAFLAAQQPPASLEDISLAISGPLSAQDKQDLFESIHRIGIDFQLDQTALTKIVTSAREGQQSDEYTAQLITELLRACIGCKERYFGPLTMDELLTMIKRQLPPQAVIVEVRQRGTRNIPKTQETIDQLSAAKAPPGLINLVVPDYDLEIAPPSGFTRVELTRAPSFNPDSPIGLFEMTVDVSGKAEFLLVNTALFVRPLNETDPKNPAVIRPLANFITAPAPNADIKFSLETAERQEADKGSWAKLWERGKSLGGRKYLTAEPGANLAAGRRGFRITIDEPDKKQTHLYKLTLQWSKPAGN